MNMITFEDLVDLCCYTNWKYRKEKEDKLIEELKNLENPFDYVVKLLDVCISRGGEFGLDVAESCLRRSNVLDYDLVVRLLDYDWRGDEYLKSDADFIVIRAFSPNEDCRIIIDWALQQDSNSLYEAAIDCLCHFIENTEDEDHREDSINRLHMIKGHRSGFVREYAEGMLEDLEEVIPGIKYNFV